MITWKAKTGQYPSGENGFVGKWCLFSHYWDSGLSKNDTETGRIALACVLPGLKPQMGHFHTPEEAKEHAEKALAHWLSGLKLEAEK